MSIEELIDNAIADGDLRSAVQLMNQLLEDEEIHS